MSGLVFYNLGKRCYSPSDQKRGRLSLVSKGEEEKRDRTFLYKAYNTGTSTLQKG